MIRCVPSAALPSIPETLPAAPDPRPRVSAIVLNRDGADHLRQLFESLLPEVAGWLDEIIVIDHGSRDASLAVCESWSDRLPLSWVAFGRNHSFSWSNNLAAERARGDYLLLLNNDIRFQDNPLPAMLAAAQATGGVVGAGQQHIAPDGSPDGPAHIGVRLTWDPRERALRPKEAAPGFADAARHHGLAAMPAVTASVLVIARATYLRLGGLAEGYDYGYEDIDLVLRVSLGAGAPVTSLNGTRVQHQEGGTRRRSKVWARARRLRRNRKQFLARWAYPAWRWWRRAALIDPGAVQGRPLAVRFGLDPHRLPGFGFDAATLAGWRGVSADELPEIRVTNQPGDGAFIGGGHPHLATVACLDSRDVAVWRQDRAALSSLDLAVVTDPGQAAALRQAGAPVVATDAELARDGLSAHLADQSRVGIVTGAFGRRARAEDAARALSEAGHPVRIARSARGLVGWADLIVTAGPVVRRPGAPWCRLGRVDTLVDRVRALDQRARRCPEDPALPDLAGEAFPDG